MSIESKMRPLLSNDGIRPNNLTMPSIFEISSDTFHMGPNADFFSLGLTREQIDKVIESHSSQHPLYLYTTGLDLDTELIAYLTEKHGPKFVLRLSAITLNNEIKQAVVTNWTSAEKLKPIIKAAWMPRIMLMCFTYEQMIEDLRALNDLKPDGLRVLISIMHYSATYPDDIKRIANISYENFPKVIDYLVQHQKDFKNFVELRFLYPSEAYAWKYRYLLRKMVRSAGPNDIILCSGSAYPTMRYVVDRRVRVFHIPNPALGSMNFATTLTTKSVIDRIGECIADGHKFKRVFVPSSIWWIEDKYDLQAQSADHLHHYYSSLDVEVIRIPREILNSNLSLQECDNYNRVRAQLPRQC